jgi:predicted nucleotide-binding protein (sugar kinase/HSP70/actin superfamily)
MRPSKGNDILKGRKLWIPRMSYAGARLSAAAFRGVGVDASETPESDAATLTLGGLGSSGEECYPAKITLGDFLRIIEADDFDPDAHAFFMPTAQGPCRFGQYGPYLRHFLDQRGHHDVPVLSPSSNDGYEAISGYGLALLFRMWRGIVAGDILTKALLRVRPYETTPGAADDAFEASLRLVEKAIENQSLSLGKSLKEMAAAMRDARVLFEQVPADYSQRKPLIGVVGEIFCRLNTFSNSEAIRRIEAHGGEAWLSDITEWVFYTNWSQRDNLRRQGKRWYSPTMWLAIIKDRRQRRDHDVLHGPWRDFFEGYEEPHDVYGQVLEPAWKYLPADGALGEMVLSVGKSIYLHERGADGVIDISPFGCMNGIVSEAVYHDVSKDHDDLPIRNFYFDDSNTAMDRDLDIFMELAANYGKRKRYQRRYPACFA